MTISFVGSFGAGTDSGSPAPVLPAGISFGDAIGAFGITSTAQTLTAPAGWTVKSGWPKDSGNARIYEWVKDSVTASDSGTAVTFTSTGSKAIVVGFVLHSGNGFPSDWTDANTWQAHTSGTTYTAPSSTSTVAGDWGVAVFGCRGTDPTPWTPVAGTERQDLQRAGSGATSLHLVDSNGSIGGASTTWGPFSETNISTSGGGALTWLVKENATGGGGGGGGGTGVSYPKLGLWADRTGVNWRTTLNGREAIYGAFQGHWTDYFTVGTVPLSSANVQAIADGKLLHIFWKPMAVSGSGSTWADVASGLRDTQLDAAAASIASVAPAQVWLTIHHEPEDDYINNGSGGAGWTAANYRGMWQRVRDRFNLVPVTNVTWVLVWQNSHSHPNEMITLYGNDGVMDGLVDIVSQQDYIAAATDPNFIATKWLEDLEFLVTNKTATRNWSYLNKPQAVTEWGADHGGINRGTNLHRAQTIDAIRGILPSLASRNVVEIRYFDARTNVIDDPPSVDGLAFQQLKDASEAGQQTGGVSIVGTALARDGATATSNTIPFVLPTGWAQGDLAEVWLSTNSNPTMTTTPAGWVLKDGPVANGTVQVAWRYEKVLQAGELDPSWVISQSVRPSGVMVVLRGADGATPIHTSAALAATASSTSHAAAAVTTTAAQAFILTTWLTRWADASGNGGVNYAVAPGTHTADGNVSVNSGANPGAGGLVAHLTASPVAPGTYGPYTATVPVTSTGICGQLAILPGGTAIAPQLAESGAAADVLNVNTGATAKTLSDSGSGADSPSVSRTGPGALTEQGAAADLLLVAVTGPAVQRPTTKVEVAFQSQPMDPTPVRTNISTYAQPVLEVTHGRADEFAEVNPGTLTGQLNNHDGRFTMGRTTGPYGSGVQIGRRVWTTVTHQSVDYPRYDGHANAWPVDWPTGRATVALAALSASDRLKRLGQIGELRSMLEEEILFDQPDCYYPLAEPDGSTSAGSVTPVPQASAVARQVGGGGEVAFGQGTGPGTDQLSAVVFTPASGTSGTYLAATPIAAGSDDAASLECWFATTAAPSPPMALCALTTVSGGEALILAMDSTGRVGAHYLGDRDALFGNTTPTTWRDGRTHHAAVTLARSGSTVTVRLYVDGVQRQTGTFDRTALGQFTQLDIGGYHVKGAFGPYNGTLSHVAAHATTLPAARVLVHYQAGATGLAGERTDQRISRVADWIGLPAADRALDVGDKLMGAQATSGKQPLQVMREAAAVEQGVLFVDLTGKLTFHRLSRRYNRTGPDLTLDCAAGHVQVGLGLPGDDFGLVNDMEVTRPGGGTQRARNPASVAEHGLYRDSLEIPASTDGDAQAVANWRVNNYGTPRARIPSLTVSLSRLAAQNSPLLAAVLGLSISSLVRLVNLPTQAPGASVDVFVEGWTERIDTKGGTWAISLNCSPADLYTVGRVGTAKVGQARVAL